MRCIMCPLTTCRVLPVTAGDHVKFGFPMAGALTILLWGLERFKDGYVAANQLDAMYDTVKWGLDYVLDAWDPFTQQLVVQVCLRLHALIPKFKRLFTTSFNRAVTPSTGLRHASFLAKKCRKARLAVCTSWSYMQIYVHGAVTPNSKHLFTTSFFFGGKVPASEAWSVQLHQIPGIGLRHLSVVAQGCRKARFAGKRGLECGINFPSKHSTHHRLETRT